jgi:hypothetical protein
VTVVAEHSRPDALEHRAIWLIALATVALVFGSFGYGVFAFADDTEWWRVALFVAGQAALVAAVGLAALSLVPGRAPPARIERVLLWAYALFWLALFFAALHVSISAIQAIGEPGFSLNG